MSTHCPPSKSLLHAPLARWRLRLVLAYCTLLAPSGLQVGVQAATTQSARPLAAAVDVRASLAWQIESFEHREGHPRSTLSLAIGEHRYALRKRRTLNYAVLSRDAAGDFGWGVPREADIACVGTYAGSGEVVYAVVNGDQVEIYLTHIDAEIGGTAFRLYRRIGHEH